MKFFISLAALALTGFSSAQDLDCEANYIVTRCVETETGKINACSPVDYACLCAANQAMATCFNNCPKDPRAAPVTNQVTIYCQQASLLNTAAATSTQAAATWSVDPSAAATSTNDDENEDDDASTTTSASNSESTNGASELMRNTGSLLLAVAGVAAVVF